jgi:hypothetical protein
LLLAATLLALAPSMGQAQTTMVDFPRFAFNGGSHDAPLIAHEKAAGRLELLAEDVNNTKVAQVLIEVLEKDPAASRKLVTMYGVVTSSFYLTMTPERTSKWLKQVDVEFVPLDFEGKPMGKAAKFTVTRNGDAWKRTKTVESRTAKAFANALTPNQKKHLYTVSGYLNANPGREPVPFTPDFVDTPIVTVVASFIPGFFAAPELVAIEAAGKDYGVNWLKGKLRSNELRYGRGGVEKLKSPSPQASAQYEAHGKKMWDAVN